ncbi:MAG: ABC transporter ATP-binding protein [Deltaproteobacteria bacterium]|nr:ABC transporter ATP-binding protein [Deltaproteobacteria bacterium]MBW1863194.1 ABC transporter ATP-binding protein [Deltaproteobacteria bacterium]
MILGLKEIHTFYGQSHILYGISLNIDNGEVVCLLGRNGAGKSTTLKSIIGIAPPRSGSIKFKGNDITGDRPFKIARMGIGYVPEDRRVFPNLTVLDNLEMGNQRAGINQWNIDRVFELFPVLRNLQNSRGMDLSGGEQQMLTIARTLMGNPELMLLDEPSEGLAPIIVKELRRLIQEIKAEMTILLAEQNAKFAMDLSDRGYIIEKGKIWFHGSIDEIKNNEEIKKKYLAV